MAFKKTVNETIRKTILVLLTVPLIVSSNTDCNRKSFHCVNSTHFMICVDLGGGVSSTIDNFVIPCPTSTECRNTNDFECEFPLLTTLAPMIATSVSSVLGPSEITTLGANFASTTAPEITSEVPLTDTNTVSMTVTQTPNITTIVNRTDTPISDLTTAAVEDFKSTTEIILLESLLNLKIQNENISNTITNEIVTTSDPTLLSVTATEFTSTLEVKTDINMIDTTFDTTSSAQTVTTEKVVDIYVTQQNEILPQVSMIDTTTVLNIDNNRLDSNQASPRETVTESYNTIKDITVPLPAETSTKTIIDYTTHRDFTEGSPIEIATAIPIIDNSNNIQGTQPPTELSTAATIDNYTVKPDLVKGAPTEIISTDKVFSNNTTQDFTQVPTLEMSSTVVVDNYATIPDVTGRPLKTSTTNIDNINTTQILSQASPSEMYSTMVIDHYATTPDFTEGPLTEMFMNSNTNKNSFTQEPSLEMSSTTIINYNTTETPSIAVKGFETQTEILQNNYSLNEGTIQNESKIMTESVLSDTTLNVTTEIYSTIEVITKLNMIGTFLETTSLPQNATLKDISLMQQNDLSTQGPPTEATTVIDINNHLVNFTQPSPTNTATENYITAKDVTELHPIGISSATTVINNINTQHFIQEPTEISQITSNRNNAIGQDFTEISIVKDFKTTTEVLSENALMKVTTQNENISNTIINDFMISNSTLNTTDISSAVTIPMENNLTDKTLNTIRPEQASTVTVTENYVSTTNIIESSPTETSTGTIIGHYTSRSDFTKGSPTKISTSSIIDNNNAREVFTQAPNTEIFTTDYTKRQDIPETPTVVDEFRTTTEMLENLFNRVTTKSENTNNGTNKNSFKHVAAKELTLTTISETNTTLDPTNKDMNTVLDVVVATQQNVILDQTDLTAVVTPTEIPTVMIIDNVPTQQDITETLPTAISTGSNIDKYTARKDVTEATLISTNTDFGVTLPAVISTAASPNEYTDQQNFFKESPTVMSTETVIDNYDIRPSLTEVSPTETSTVTIIDTYTKTQDLIETPAGMFIVESPTGMNAAKNIETNTATTEFTVTPADKSTATTNDYSTRQDFPGARPVGTETTVNNITRQDLPEARPIETTLNNITRQDLPEARPVGTETTINNINTQNLPEARPVGTQTTVNNITRQDFTATHLEKATEKIIDNNLKQDVTGSSPIEMPSIVNINRQDITGAPTEKSTVTVIDSYSVKQYQHEASPTGRSTTAAIVEITRHDFTTNLTETPTITVIDNYTVRQDLAEASSAVMSTVTIDNNYITRPVTHTDNYIPTITDNNTKQDVTVASPTEISSATIINIIRQDLTPIEKSTPSVMDNYNTRQNFPQALERMATSTTSSTEIYNTSRQGFAETHKEKAVGTMTDINSTRPSVFDTPSATITYNYYNNRQGFTETSPTKTPSVMIIDIKKDFTEELPREKSTVTMIDNNYNTGLNFIEASVTETPTVKSIGLSIAQAITDSKLTGSTQTTNDKNYTTKYLSEPSKETSTNKSLSESEFKILNVNVSDNNNITNHDIFILDDRFIKNLSTTETTEPNSIIVTEYAHQVAINPQININNEVTSTTGPNNIYKYVTEPNSNKQDGLMIITDTVTSTIPRFGFEIKTATLDTTPLKGSASVERTLHSPSFKKVSVIDTKYYSPAAENLATSNILDSTKAPAIEKISLISQAITGINSDIKSSTTPLISLQVSSTNSESHQSNIKYTGREQGKISADHKTTSQSRPEEKTDTENKNATNNSDKLTSDRKLKVDTIASTQREEMTPSTLTQTSVTTQRPLDGTTKPNNADLNSSQSTGANPLLSFCEKRNRGRYSDSDDCTKFYICIGRKEPIIGKCPVNTVFSDIKKQCTRNKSHCVRGNEFKCTCDGRFSDIIKNNIYYICVKRLNTFIRFQFQCQAGYYLNKTTVRCSKEELLHHQSISIDKNSEISSSDSKNSNDETNHNKKPEKSVKQEAKEKEVKEDFLCSKEGKFVDPNSCKKYYVCSKRKNSEFRRRRKSCDSDERFHKDKKKCVDADSYEC